MGLTYRGDLDRPLNTAEIDDNFRYFTGSHAVTGSVTATEGFVGSLTGSVNGVADSAVTASHALFAEVAESSSYAALATTAETASYVENAQTASYVEIAQTASYVSLAESASYVSATNVDGTVANATAAVTSSFAAGAFLFAAVDPLPTPVNGALIVSSSGDLYFGSGSNWNLVSL